MQASHLSLQLWYVKLKFSVFLRHCMFKSHTCEAMLFCYFKIGPCSKLWKLLFGAKPFALAGNSVSMRVKLSRAAVNLWVLGYNGTLKSLKVDASASSVWRVPIVIETSSTLSQLLCTLSLEVC